MEKEREVRLHRQIEDIVRSRVSILEQDISRLQREVNESFTRLLERTDQASSLPESDHLLAQMSADINAQVDKAGAESARLGADIALLRDSVAELDEQHTQAEVLNTLIARAANFAPRVILFVVKAGNALAWAARGFEERGGNNAIRGMSIPLQADTALRLALNSQQAFYGAPDQQAENHLLLSRLGSVQPQRILTLPLKVRGKSAALLYADSADHGEGATNVEAIELLVHTAGLVVELVSLRARMSESAQSPAKQPVSQPPVGAEPPRTSGPIPGTSAPLAQPQVEPSGELRPASPSVPAYSRTTGDLPRSAEPQPAMSPPSVPSMRPAGNIGAQAADNPGASALRGSIDEEEKQHNDARRFARLLVSEIKLYNEQKVSDGRRNNDLYDRLKEDIDRSRQMYEKRVTPTVAAKFDYFYDELVNTLAEGDAAKLGSDYPGPTVRV